MVSLKPKLLLIYSPLLVIVIIACLEFALLLRHKTPYLSDSYFYNHIFYRLQGYTHDEAYDKILKKIDVNRLGDVGKNIFLNPDKYEYSLSRYIRRPLYPFFSYLIYPFFKNEYFAFIAPVFITYVGSIILIYLVFSKCFERFLTSLGTALFVGFYPFIDWSTYFLTDTIGLFFWMLQIYLVLRYLESPKAKYLWMFVLSLLLSLLNREQGVLIPLVIAIVLVGVRIFKISKLKVYYLKRIFIISAGISFLYLAFNHLLKQPSLYDSWIYLESNFGYYSESYSFSKTFRFLVSQLIVLHKGLLLEFARHRWWTMITLLGFLGFFRLFIIRRTPKLIDLLILGSSFAAYINLIIIPYLSYRYFYPTIIGVIYFSLYSMKSLLNSNKLPRTENPRFSPFSGSTKSRS